ncbi:MAG: aldose epimerase family protein [Akkermansiaceae bacterium]
MKIRPALFLLGFALAMTSCNSNDSGDSTTNALTLETTTFGTTADGKSVKLFTLKNGLGHEAKVTEYGAILTSMKVPDRDGKSAEITLGYGDDLAAWEKSTGYFGATVGRYGNRIADGKFTLDGKDYELATNNEPGGMPCHLHGGLKGFDKVVWEGRPLESSKAVGVELTYRSVDGEEGYPGNLDVTVRYLLTIEGELSYQVDAKTDAPTPVNIVQHTYWNLTGDTKNTILDHELQILADQFLPTNEGLIPTGELASVEGTPMDFTSPHLIGARINEETEALKFGGGYDHCWVLRAPEEKGQLRLAAVLHDPKTGRVMEVLTNQPGVQFYSGNFLDGNPSELRTALCLETQRFPDSPNKPEFPTSILKPGETYHHSQVFRFSTK